MTSEYIMPEEEIQALLGALSLGDIEEIFYMTKLKAALSMNDNKELDLMFINMSDFLLNRARQTEDEDLKNKYYDLSYMLKRVAHYMHYIYVKKNIKEENSRFIRLCK